MAKRKPSLLPSGWYHGTIRQSYWDGDLIHLWTIDVGPKKWQNVKRRYPDTEAGRHWLKNAEETLNTDFSTDPENHVGTRGKLKIDRKVDGKVLRNIIIELQVPEIPPEVDVLKEKSDDHFFHNKSKRDLPIGE